MNVWEKESWCFWVKDNSSFILLEDARDIFKKFWLKFVANFYIFKIGLSVYFIFLFLDKKIPNLTMNLSKITNIIYY